MKDSKKYLYDADGKQFEVISHRKLTLWERVKILFGGTPPDTKQTVYQYTGLTKENS